MKDWLDLLAGYCSDILPLLLLGIGIVLGTTILQMLVWWVWSFVLIGIFHLNLPDLTII